MYKISYDKNGEISMVTGPTQRYELDVQEYFEPEYALYPSTLTLAEMGLLRRGSFQSAPKLGILVTHDLIEELVFPVDTREVTKCHLKRKQRRKKKRSSQ